jgi:hypothetical protein
MHWTVYEEVAPLGYYKIDGAVTDFTSDPLGLVGNIHTVLDPIINQPILGELQWSKIDSKGNLLSGSQWELSSSSAGISRTYTVIDNTGDADYETTSGCIPDIPSDGSIAPASAQILVVCDQDPTPGKFDVTSLAPESSWSIYETLAPSGYQRLSGQAASAIWLSYTNPRGNYNQIVNHLAPTNPGTPGVPNTGSLDTKGSTATPVLGGILFVTLTSLTILGYKITKIRKSKD